MTMYLVIAVLGCFCMMMCSLSVGVGGYFVFKKKKTTEDASGNELEDE